MKKSLITLHTNNTNAHFDNIFNDEIIIEPETEIAFHSCCLRLDNFRVNVNNSNKLISLKIGTADVMRHLIEPGSYADNQVQYLLEDVQNDFNQQLNINNENDNGQQIRLNLSRKNIVSLDILKASISQGAVSDDGGTTFQSNTKEFLTGGTVSVDSATGSYLRTGSSAIGDNITNFLHGRIPLTRGCGFCSVEVTALRAFNANVQDGCIMLVTEEKNPDLHKSRTASTTLFYVRVPFKVGEPYMWAAKEGSYDEEATTAVCAIGDVVQIELSEGLYQLAIYKAGVATVKTNLLDTREKAPVYNDSVIGKVAPPLYMTVGFLGPTFRGRFNYISDPFQNNPSKNSLALVGLAQDPPAFSKGNNIDHVLTFQTDELASSFGFDDRITTITDTDQCTFTATEAIDRTTHPNNFKVEMLNIQLESFDSQKEGRMNILSTIPVDKEFKDQQLSILNFQPENMFYLSIRNKERLSLRNIRARIIDANNNPITLLGFSSINLLIKSPHE